jgi:ketosteroid isomerase-like protein
MRYVRCRECGSPEVPALATCPACGIKTDVMGGRPWALLAAVLFVGAGAGAALGLWGLPAMSSSSDDQSTDVEDTSAGTPRHVDPALQRKIDALTRERDALRAQVATLANRTTEPPPSVPLVSEPSRDSRLRVAHVRWVTAYLTVARVWQAPYVPMAHVRALDSALTTLETRTRELSAAAAATTDDAAWLPAGAMTQFEQRLAAFKQALGRTRPVTVNANEDWHQGDVEVAAGDLVYLAAQGQWHLGGTVAAEDGEPPELAPLVNTAPLGALLWRVRGSGAVHAAAPANLAETASSRPLVADVAGPLEFRVNEQFLQDNSGAVTAEVLVLPKSLITPLDAAGTQIVGG